MNPLNRAAGYVVLGSLLALSACVIAPDRGYGHGDPHPQASDNRHSDGAHCNPNEDHHGDACGDVDHH
jgi:hypothetical protein